MEDSATNVTASATEALAILEGKIISLCNEYEKNYPEVTLDNEIKFRRFNGSNYAYGRIVGTSLRGNIYPKLSCL